MNKECPVLWRQQVQTSLFSALSQSNCKYKTHATIPEEEVKRNTPHEKVGCSTTRYRQQPKTGARRRALRKARETGKLQCSAWRVDDRHCKLQPGQTWGVGPLWRLPLFLVATTGQPKKNIHLFFWGGGKVNKSSCVWLFGGGDQTKTNRNL